jgi:biotin transport system substrate-specific component
LRWIVQLEKKSWVDLLHVVLGSLFIALLSSAEIPLTPVPITLQTFAIFVLALFQGGSKAALSLLMYLAEATLGLPVFGGPSSDPFWILCPSAGYCLAFPLAAYLTGKISELRSPFPFVRMLIGCFCGQAVVYLLGVTWLSFYIGLSQALILGLYPFIMFDGIKLLTAVAIRFAVLKMK